MAGETYADLGPYGDLVDLVRAAGPLFPEGTLTRETARALLRFEAGGARDLRVERTWEADGVAGEVLSWSVGYGPRTEAFLLKPARAAGRLPGVLALYDHGHFKVHGKEKIVDGPEGAPAAVGPFRDLYYSGRSWANALAREGFAVLAHDTFLFGSRRFPLEAMPPGDMALGEAAGATLGHGAIDPAVLAYHGAAFLHEHQVAKYLTVLGTSLAAVTAYEDRAALSVLAARGEVDAARLGALGFSGGGFRAGALAATADGLKAAGVSGMMATTDALLSRHIVPHTWMLFPPGLGAVGDLPDLAACAAPAPLMVQYALGDAMFTEAGMRAAAARIRGYYERAGAPGKYRAAFHAGPHRFDAAMQAEAFGWLGEVL